MTDGTKEEKDFLEMTDEEIMNMPMPEDIGSTDEKAEGDNLLSAQSDSNDDNANTDEKENDEPKETSVVEDIEELDDSDNSNEIYSDGQEETDSYEDNEDEEEDDGDNAPETDLEADKDDNSEEVSDDANKEKVDNEGDYKAKYNKLKRVLEPFKANGSDFQVDNVDQAIQLMQKGLGFNAKMTKLKPGLKILKTLENHSLLDENKINWLIDLSKKDPKAINQLIKDSGIDPLEVDVEDETGYQPNSYQVSDTEIEVEEVLEEIKTTPTYNQTIKILGEQWDEDSRDALVKNPREIKHINDQVASGVYKQIMDTVTKYRALGELQGFSDYDAYCAVGSYMTKNQMFNGQGSKQKPTQTTKTKSNDSTDVPDQGSNNKQDSKLKDRKKAASSTSATPKKKKGPLPNPLDVPDDEFNNLPAPNI